MQVFRELYIHGEPAQLAATVQAICGAMTGDWSRDAELEELSRRRGIPDQEHVYSFKCLKQGLRSPVNLFLKDKDKHTLEVTNIVPQAVGQLTYDEYNAVMEEFVELFVRPAAARTGVQVEMTEAEADLERWVSPATAKKLRRFCAWPYRGHESDREFWKDFIVSAHREGANLDSTTLRRWLLETGKWDEDESYNLASEYARFRDILAHADRQAVGV